MYTSYLFELLVNPYFTELHKLWYIKVNERNIKIISLNITKLLTDVNLAYWLMGDGHLDKEGKIILSTHSFKLAEVVLLKNALFYNFEIFSNIYCFNKTKEQYILSIPKKRSL